MPELGGQRARAAVLAAVAVAAAGAGAAYYRWERQAASAQANAAADLYARTLADADGRPQPISRWRGSVLVVNFWATWCAPCVAEMPALDRLQQEYATRGVVIVGLGTENLERVRSFRDRLGLHLFMLAGEFDALAIARNLGDAQGVLPYTAVFSRSGVLLHAHLGELPSEALRAWLDEALKAEAAGQAIEKPPQSRPSAA